MTFPGRDKKTYQDSMDNYLDLLILNQDFSKKNALFLSYTLHILCFSDVFITRF